MGKSGFANKVGGIKQASGVGDAQSIDKDPLYSVSNESSRTLSFILFSEILEDSPVQSRANVFDPNKSPKDKELLESIKVSGIVQPIVVRSIEDDGGGLYL